MFIAQVCVRYLLKSALTIEGIFRMSGSKREIAGLWMCLMFFCLVLKFFCSKQGIISKFNRGENVVLDQETSDEHSVAGLLKHWV
jgi:hypothetical protein